MMRRLSLGVAFWLLAGAALAADALPPPPDLNQRVGFDQHIGDTVPLALDFRDANDREVSLRGLAHGKPLLLALGYYRCKNLCGVLLQGMAHSVAAMALRPGSDYAVAFVSIDPRETPADAAASQRRTAGMAPHAEVADWHFLTGGAAAIRELTHAVGYRYFYDPRIDQFAHAAGVVVLAGDGRVAQYLFGVQFPPRTLRLALVGASHGRLGNVIDQLVLLCCGYDPSTGRYSLLIGRVMQVLGGASVLLLGLALLCLHRRRGGVPP